MKNNKRQLVIKIGELPFRSENLGNRILLEIYGGECTEKGGWCNPDCANNCCANYICDLVVCS